MKLVSMERKAEKKSGDDCCIDDHEKYPWGLQLDLNEESIKMLGLEDLPKIDTEFQVHAVAIVTRISSNESTDGENRSMTLQITSLGLDTGEKDVAKALYGKKGDE